MEYLLWILLALLTYSLVGPIVKTIEADVPTAVDVFVTTAVMLGVTALSILLTGPVDPTAIPADSYLLALVSGGFLAVGVLAFFWGLELGPVSVVVPIFGLFIVVSSVIGILLFGESSSVRKVLGILVAVVAIYLTADDRPGS